jgi:hypothetical protein
VVLIVEDQPVYHSREVRAYVDSTGGALCLQYLPTAASGHNPEA